MKNSKLNNQTILPFWLIAISVVSRLLPHPPNFTAVGSSALYGGRYLSGLVRYIIPIVAMLITDFFLGWHKTMIFVYSALLINVWLGSRLNSKSKWYGILGTAAIGSLVFYIITNFGVWIMGPWYPHTLSGLINCYVLAIPFAKWTLAGDLVFTTVLFGVTAIILNKRLTQPTRRPRFPAPRCATPKHMRRVVARRAKWGACYAESKLKLVLRKINSRINKQKAKMLIGGTQWQAK